MGRVFHIHQCKDADTIYVYSRLKNSVQKTTTANYCAPQLHWKKSEVSIMNMIAGIEMLLALWFRPGGHLLILSPQSLFFHDPWWPSGMAFLSSGSSEPPCLVAIYYSLVAICWNLAPLLCKKWSCLAALFSP